MDFASGIELRLRTFDEFNNFVSDYPSSVVGVIQVSGSLDSTVYAAHDVIFSEGEMIFGIGDVQDSDDTVSVVVNMELDSNLQDPDTVVIKFVPGEFSRQRSPCFLSPHRSA